MEDQLRDMLAIARGAGVILDGLSLHKAGRDKWRLTLAGLPVTAMMSEREMSQHIHRLAVLFSMMR